MFLCLQVYIPVNTASQLSGPISIERDSSSGTLYISDTNNHRVVEYLVNASFGTVVAGGNGGGTGITQLYNPRGLYFDLSTNSLLIANNYAHNIVRWVLGASSWTLVIGSASGTAGITSTMLNYPTHIVLDSFRDGRCAITEHRQTPAMKHWNTLDNFTDRESKSGEQFIGCI
ncbi:unnamed protein product [Adineta steineri]|uniref:Uncharacterized protein n=1 Tax=Adineta steineri TaxID=433720 RepID=A0A814AQE1_9BILA|nr:unnamed protein product [Adineta steineri]